MPSLPAARSSGSLCSRDLILKLLHINSTILSKLPCEFIFAFTKLPISQFFDEFTNAAKWFVHVAATASFPVSPPTVDGSHDFLLFLMFCQNFLGDLFGISLSRIGLSLNQLKLVIGLSRNLFRISLSRFGYIPYRISLSLNQLK